MNIDTFRNIDEILDSQDILDYRVREIRKCRKKNDTIPNKNIVIRIGSWIKRLFRKISKNREHKKNRKTLRKIENTF